MQILRTATSGTVIDETMKHRKWAQIMQLFMINLNDRKFKKSHSEKIEKLGETNIDGKI